MAALCYCMIALMRFLGSSLGLTVVFVPSLVSATVLYDGSSGSLPSAGWGWTYNSLGGGVVSGPSGGAVSLDTSIGHAIQAGWTLVSPVSIDRTAGAVVSWRSQVLAESHNQDNQRAGFSVTVIGSDLFGIEVAMWEDRIFVYNADTTFTPGEFVSFDTTDVADYHLAISGSSYNLSANGVQILTGALRNYSPFNPFYGVGNLIAIGDNTTRAASHFEWHRMSVVPEPMTLAALGLGALLVRRRRRR